MGDGEQRQLRERLQQWLRMQRPNAQNLCVGPFSAAEAGASNQTLLFDVGWQAAGEQLRESLVLRMQPSGPGVFPEYRLDEQYRAMQLLADTEVPVPRLAGFEADASVLGAPFYLMQRIDGRVVQENPPYHMGGWFAQLSDAERGEIWRNGIRAVAEVNRQDWSALGFRHLRPPPGETPLQQQLRYYRGFLDWIEGRGQPYPKLRAVRDWLQDQQPEDEPVALCWGDAKIANLLIDGTEVSAVLDWEMVCLGNPVADLAWWMTLDNALSEGLGPLVGHDVPKLGGLPDRDEMIALWEAQSGHSAARLDYHELLAAYKFAVIMASIAIDMQATGRVPAAARMDVNNASTAVLDRLMGQFDIATV